MIHKNTVVVSAINIFEAGPLNILKECLNELSKQKSIKLVALVHNKKPIQAKNIQFIEFKYSRKSFLFRFFYEYFYFRFLARRLKPSLWLSLHDITPSVPCAKITYFHNPSILYKVNLKTFIFDYKILIFKIFYKYLYKINCKKNIFIICQQKWFAKEILKITKFPKIKVFPPKTLILKNTKNISNLDFDNNLMYFIYPSKPRSFKNFEVIIDSLKFLNSQIKFKIQILFTITGKENLYSRYISYIAKKYQEVKLIGFHDYEKMYQYYRQTNCLLFPSKLETFGLPLQEFKLLNKKIIASDLPYAREVLSGYKGVLFCDPNKPIDWAKAMETFIETKRKTVVLLQNKKSSSQKNKITWSSIIKPALQKK